MIDLDALERTARAARPGPWQWFGNTKMHSVYLATVHGGRVFVLDFERWGMRGAQPRFQVDQRMVTLGDLAKEEHPLGPKFEVPYRRDFHGIGHPDAAHIAANDPSTTLALIARIRELEAQYHAYRQLLEVSDRIVRERSYYRGSHDANNEAHDPDLGPWIATQNALALELRHA